MNRTVMSDVVRRPLRKGPPPRYIANKHGETFERTKEKKKKERSFSFEAFSANGPLLPLPPIIRRTRKKRLWWLAVLRLLQRCVGQSTRSTR